MVIVPPVIAQNPMGISSRPKGILLRVAIREMTGRKSAVAPTFCMNPEITPTVPDTSGMIRVSVRPPMRRIAAAMTVMTPVRSRPAPRIMTAMIEMTALLAKPSKS